MRYNPVMNASLAVAPNHLVFNPLLILVIPKLSPGIFQLGHGILG